MSIVIIGNSNYDSMLFYLVVTLAMAAIYTWVRPYKSRFLNIFNGLVLQLMLAVVIISSYEFLQSATTTLALVLVIIPLIVMIVAAGVWKIIHRNRHQYFGINEGNDNDDDTMR